MRSNARRYCLVCDQIISRHTERRSIFRCFSNMDEVDRGLSERLEVILDTKLAENQAHSEEICHLCEAQMVQIEEYFRLLIIFRETYRQTWKKHSQSQSTSQLKGKSSRQRKKEPAQSLRESKQRLAEVTSRPSRKKNKKFKATPNEKSIKEKQEATRVPKAEVAQNQSNRVTPYLSDYDVDTEDNDGDEGPEKEGARDVLELREISSKPGSVHGVDPIAFVEGSEKVTDSQEGLEMERLTEEQAVMVDDPPGLDVSEKDGTLDLAEARTSQVQAEVRSLPVPSPSDKSLPVQNSTKLPIQRFLGKRKFRCMACSKQFATLRNLKRHQKVHSGDHRKMLYACPVCSVKFSHKVSLKSHVKGHRSEGVEIHPCQGCAQMFLNKEDLAQHLVVGGCPLKNPHKCSECSRAYRCHSELELHKLSHQGQKPFKCDICEKAFSRKQTLKEHRRVHQNIKPYTCNLCPESFKFRSNLKQHIIKHSPTKSHRCHECSASFSAASSLHNHLKVHQSENPFLCSVCGRGFKQTNSLQLHLRVHSSDRPFTCVNCGASFKRADILQRHMLIHTGAAPYKCSECTSCFRDRKSYRNHLLNHKKIKPYTCGTCQKSFVDKKVLRCHERLHTGEKAYKCTVCEKAFALPQYLKRHVRTHNKDVNAVVKRKKRAATKACIEEPSGTITEEPGAEVTLEGSCITTDSIVAGSEEQQQNSGMEVSSNLINAREHVAFLVDENLGSQVEEPSVVEEPQESQSLVVLQTVPQSKDVTSHEVDTAEEGTSFPLTRDGCAVALVSRLEFPSETSDFEVAQRYPIIPRMRRDDSPLTQIVMTSCHEDSNLNASLTSQHMSPMEKTILRNEDVVEKPVAFQQTVPMTMQNKVLPLLPMTSHSADSLVPSVTEIMSVHCANDRPSNSEDHSILPQTTEGSMACSPQILMPAASKGMMQNTQELMMSHDLGGMSAHNPDILPPLAKGYCSILSRGGNLQQGDVLTKGNDFHPLARKSTPEFKCQMPMNQAQRSLNSVFLQKEAGYRTIQKDVCPSMLREDVPCTVSADNLPLYQRTSQLQTPSFLYNPDATPIPMNYTYQDGSPSPTPSYLSSAGHHHSYPMVNETQNQVPNRSKTQSVVNYSPLQATFPHTSHPHCLTVSSTIPTSSSSLYYLAENMPYSRPLPPLPPQSSSPHHSVPQSLNSYPADDYNKTLNLKTDKDMGSSESALTDSRYIIGAYGSHEASLMLGFPNNSNLTARSSEQDRENLIAGDAFSLAHGHLPLSSDAERPVASLTMIQDLQKKT